MLQKKIKRNCFYCWKKENALMHFLEYRKMIRKKNGLVGKLCVRNFWDGKKWEGT